MLSSKKIDCIFDLRNKLANSDIFIIEEKWHQFTSWYQKLGNKLQTWQYWQWVPENNLAHNVAILELKSALIN